MTHAAFDDAFRTNLLQSLAREFWAAGGQAPLIMQGLMRRDWFAVRQQAHTLKGTAAILGAANVSLLAAALEEAVSAEAPDLSHAIDLAADLNGAMAGVLRAVLSMQARPAAAAGVPLPRLTLVPPPSAMTASASA